MQSVGTTNNANWEHLCDDLEILNASLLSEVRRQSGQRKPSHLDQLQGLVINEEEIIAILSEAPDRSGSRQDRNQEKELAKLEKNLACHRQDSEKGTTYNLVFISEVFKLGPIEERCLVLCLAPEIDREYAKVFAYLQDDVTKRQPSVGLALRLFAANTTDRVAGRRIFAPTAPLVRNRLVHLETSDTPAPFSDRFLKLDDRIAALLLDTPEIDGRLADWVELVTPPEQPVRTGVPNQLRDRTVRFAESCFMGGEAPVRPVVYLYGRYGAGRRSLAECVCQRIGLALLAGDLRRLPPAADRGEALWRLAREALLQPAGIYLEHVDDLLEDGRRAELGTFLEAVRTFSPLTFLSGTAPWKSATELVPRQVFLSLECPVPDSTARISLWKERLEDTAHKLGDDDLGELAGKFSFTDGQIRDAVAAARSRAHWEEQPQLPLSTAAIHQACRSQATPHLGDLARKIEPSYDWSDIVLPADQVEQLKEIVTHVKRAQIILGTWGFAGKFPYGRGVTALFEGGSGTGKTMAAEIIAAELKLDLYRIDLSGVVSKYIGETEKNLSRIFAEAQDSNAILFFDEADALFGKRSAVKDAHDRYANIETAYLLQRIEEYSGAVILATNLKQNLDEAFVRRMRFIIHFPFPNDADRERIWRKVFPQQAPLAEDINFGWLGRKLQITGGNIKNISLRAAYLAMERSQVAKHEPAIDMACVIAAVKRELEKIGKIYTPADLATWEQAKSARVQAEVA